MDARDANIIHEGDTVICMTSSAQMFFQIIKQDETIRLGKKVLSLQPVIDTVYGSVFEEKDNTMVRVMDGLFPDPRSMDDGEGIFQETDNRNYTDTNSAQKLSATQIAQLKDGGLSGKDIIRALMQNSSTWEDRSDFSKEKYLKKKQQKYMPRVRFLKCTAETLCKTYRTKNPQKICNIREDTLGQLLNYANIYASAQVLVVDTCMGLVIGAIAERQNGNGRILAGYDGRSPNADILRRFNFDKRTRQSIYHYPLKDIGRHEQLGNDIDSKKSACHSMDISVKENLAKARALKFTEEERKKYDARKLRQNQSRIERQPLETIRNWFQSKSDCLVIASHYDPTKMLEALLPYLSASRPFVVYSEFLEPLTKAFSVLHKMQDIIDIQLSESWTREYQILPERSHPEMNMSACSGYLLSGIKIENSICKNIKLNM